MWILALTRAMIALAVLKTSWAWEASTAFLFRVSIMLLRSDASVLFAIATDLVRGAGYKQDNRGRIERV